MRASAFRVPGFLVLATLLVTGVVRADFSAWPTTMPITFDGYEGSETLIDFPVLVVFSNNVGGSGFDYDEFASASGDDLRFTDVLETTELAYEIEQWNTNGTSLIWVRVPALSNATSIVAQWGNSEAESPAYTTNGAVWSAAYRGVWHLNNDPSGTAPQVRDSSANALHGTAFNMVAGDRVEGAYGGKALFFDNVDNHVVADMGAIGAPLTVHAWVYVEQLSQPQNDFDYALEIRPTGSGDPNLSIGRWGNGDNRYYSRENNANRTGPVLAGQQWLHLMAVYPSATPYHRLYINGSAVSVEAFGAAASSQGRLVLGRYHHTASHHFYGRMDGLRVSTTARSADWALASYLNQASNTQFNTYGQVTASDLPIVSIDPATNVTAGSAWLNGRLESTQGQPTALRVHWGTAGPEGPWAASHSFGEDVAVGAYSHQASGLTGDQLYYYRFSGSNTAGEVWSPAQLFATAAVTVEASVPAASKVDGTPGQFTLTRPTAITNAALTVHYTVSGSASNGVDYATLGGTAYFPAGATAVTVTVTPLASSRLGALEAVLTLADKTVIPGSPASATVTIAPVIAGDWKYAMPITFEGYTGSETLMDFPALVVFSNNVADSGFDYGTLATATGADLWFANEAGDELLYHEVQSWDPDGVSYAWVRVPELTINTAITAHWGASGMTTAPAYTTNGLAWSAGYRAVWHLAETVGTRYDATVYNQHATPSGNLTAAADGFIGTGLAFDGATNSYLSVGNPQIEEQATFEAWIKPTETVRVILTQAASEGVLSGTIQLVDDGLVGARTLGPGTHTLISLIPIADLAFGEWQHIAVVFSGSATAYLNGVAKGSGTISPAYNQSLLLGGRRWNQFGNTFLGTMDEVRLSSVPRSADWIKASHDTQAQPLGFAMYGEIIAPPAGTLFMIR